jgi:hypothetical protein
VPDPPPVPLPPLDCINGPALAVVECSGPQHTADVRRGTDELGDLTGQPCNDNLLKLRDKLRSYGLCAIGGEADSDAVFIRRSDGLVEENHACFYGTGSWTGSGNGRFVACHTDGPTGCTDPRPPKVESFALKKHNNLFDATPRFFGREYCTAIGAPDRLRCPARIDCPAFKCEERAACERVGVGGDPLWRGDGTINATDNPYQVRCGSCTWVEVCSTDGTVCQRLTL